MFPTIMVFLIACLAFVMGLFTGWLSDWYLDRD